MLLNFLKRIVVFLILPLFIISIIRIANNKSPIFDLNNMILYLDEFPTDNLEKIENFTEEWNILTNEFKNVSFESISFNFNGYFEDIGGIDIVIDILKAIGNILMDGFKAIGALFTSLSSFMGILFDFIILMFKFIVTFVGLLLDSVWWVLRLPAYIITN